MTLPRRAWIRCGREMHKAGLRRLLPIPLHLSKVRHSEVVTANLTKVIQSHADQRGGVQLHVAEPAQQFCGSEQKCSGGSLGLDYNMLFNHADPDKLIFPQMTGWGDGISNMLNAGFELNGTVYAKKTLPSSGGQCLQGLGNSHHANLVSIGSAPGTRSPEMVPSTVRRSSAVGAGAVPAMHTADMLIGQATQYSETNLDVVPAFRYLWRRSFTDRIPGNFRIA